MKKLLILLCFTLLLSTALNALTTMDSPGYCKESPSGYHAYVVLSEEAATCTEYGRVVRECEYCREREEITLDDQKPLGHTYVSKSEGGNCTSEKRTWDECTRCGSVINETSSGSGLGHNYVHQHRDATCTVAEADWDECTRCGDKINYSEGDKGEHSWVEDYKRDATCTEKGFVYYRCSVCGTYSDFYDELPPSGHDYRAVETIDATCVTDGYIKYRCIFCSAEYSVPLTATGIHDYRMTDVQKASCTEDGEATYTCLMCKDSYTNAIKATGHNYTKTERVEATCIDDGYTVYTCSVCGDEYNKPIKAQGHKYVDRAVEATCTEKATSWKECSVCGDIKDKVETGSALGHIWSESDSDGYSICQRCGKREQSSIKITFSSSTINNGETTEKKDESSDIVKIAEDKEVTTINEDNNIVIINEDDSSDDIVIIIVPDDEEEEETTEDESSEEAFTRTASVSYIGCTHDNRKTIKKGKYDCERVEVCTDCGEEIPWTHSYSITKDGCTYTTKCIYGCGAGESYTFHKHITAKVSATGLFKLVKENGKAKLKYQMAAYRSCTECGEIIEKKTWYVSSISNYENEWNSDAYAIYSKGDEYPVMPSDWPKWVSNYIKAN